MLHLLVPALLMAWMFSLGCCCGNAIVFTAGIVNLDATVVAGGDEGGVGTDDPDNNQTLYKFIDCSMCTDLSAPFQVQVDFDGVEDIGITTCEECGSFNSISFILDQQDPQPQLLPNSLCQWIWEGAIPCDGEEDGPCVMIFQIFDVVPVGSGFHHTRLWINNLEDDGSCATDASLLSLRAEAFATVQDTPTGDCSVLDKTIEIANGDGRVHCEWNADGDPPPSVRVRAL